MFNKKDCKKCSCEKWCDIKTDYVGSKEIFWCWFYTPKSILERIKERFNEKSKSKVRRRTR